MRSCRYSPPARSSKFRELHLLPASWNLRMVIFLTEHVAVKKATREACRSQGTAKNGLQKKRKKPKLLSAPDRCPWTLECCFLWKRNLLFVPGFLALYSSSFFTIFFFFFNLLRLLLYLTYAVFLLQSLFTFETSSCYGTPLRSVIEIRK